MKMKRVFATVLIALVLLTSTGCKNHPENISVSFSDIMKQFDDDTLLDEVLEESKKNFGIETDLIDETIKLEEYIKLIEQISKLNIPTPKEIAEDTINEFSSMSIAEVYSQIEKQQIILGTGTEILARESGLHYLQKQYKTWIKENGPQITKELLKKTLETAVLTADGLNPTSYSHFDIEERIEYTDNNSSIYIDVTNKDKNQTTTYIIGDKSKALSALAASFHELEQLTKEENVTYEQIAQSCSNALDAVKIFVVAGVSLDNNTLVSEKTSNQSKRLILKK